MGRKSVDLTQGEEHELTIVKNKRKATVDDYLPPYTFEYDEIEKDKEADAMYQSLKAFIEENSNLVLEDYESKSEDAIREGFQRAIAIVDLFFTTIYLTGGMDDQ